MENLLVGTSRVVVGRGVLDDVLPENPGRRQVALVTQAGATRYADQLAKSFRESGLSVEIFGLPDREEAKTIEVASAIYQRLGRLGVGRADTVVGVGGGSVTDLAGFVAGTWMRGIEVVHVPTTLLAAVDAAIGGKTGVNLGGKNLVGVFWSPSRVVVDLDILEALPSTLFLEGISESLKAGLVGDVGLFELIESKGLSAPLDEVVIRAIRVKAGFVETDPYDREERAMLNFGHTIGHAIEFASPLSHGLAVGVGMIAASAVSERDVAFGHRERINQAIRDLGLAPDVSGLDRTRVVDLLNVDKKNDAGRLRMVLLEDLGHPTLRHVGQQSVDLALRAIGLPGS